MMITIAFQVVFPPDLRCQMIDILELRVEVKLIDVPHAQDHSSAAL